MNVFDPYKIGCQPNGARSLFDRARKYIGAVKGPLIPKNTAAQAKAMVSCRVSEVGRRSRASLAK